MRLGPITLVATLALLLIAAALGATSAHAAPKPGFLPGTWIGKGTIQGELNEDGMRTTFSGGVSFTLDVASDLAVTGTGKWQMGMRGKQDAPASYAVNTATFGSAAIRLKGTATNVTYAGTQLIKRKITSAGKSVLMAPLEKPLSNRLVITRAGKCKVTGTTVIQPGVTLTWSAQLKGSGTCNA